MGGDFTGIGTSVVYGRLLADLVSVTFVGTVSGVKQVHALLKRCKPGATAGCSGGNLLGQVHDVLLEALASGRLKSSSIDKYAIVLAQFISSLGCDDPGAVNGQAVAEFRRRRAAGGVGRGAQRVDLCALRTVLDRLLGLETTDSMHYAPRPDRVPGATREQVPGLMAAAVDDMDRLLLLLLNVLKLRPGQIAALRVADFRPLLGGVVVRHDKPEKSFLAPLPGELLTLLVRVLRDRDPDGWIFSSSRCPVEPVSVRALQKRLARICGRCGVTVTCTELRKAESCISGDPIDAIPSSDLQPASGRGLTPSRAALRLGIFIPRDHRGPPG